MIKYNGCQRKLSFLNYNTNETIIRKLYLKAMIRYSSILVYFDGITYKSQFITFGIYCMLYPTHIVSSVNPVRFCISMTASTIGSTSYLFNELVGGITANMNQADAQIAERLCLW